MYAVVRLMTSMRRDEVERIDKLSVATGNGRYHRAGVLRAMLRFVLDREEEFLVWFKEEDGKPVEGGEKP